MQINVETKFDVGQEVFHLKETRKVIENRQTCKICNGVGHITYKGYTISCPECHGHRFACANSKIMNVYSVDERTHTITSIGITITAKSVKKPRYKIDGDRFERKNVEENALFATREEAEKRCNELNREVQPNENDAATI